MSPAAASRRIVGEERNAWRAAKKIAEWVDREVTANYDVGFASAREILDHREGDCSEHTVLFVALCRATSAKHKAEFEDLWRRLGISAAWSLCYSTIDERSIRISQRAFSFFRRQKTFSV